MPRACIVFNLIPVFFGKNVKILHVTGSILENLFEPGQVYGEIILTNLILFNSLPRRSFAQFAANS